MPHRHPGSWNACARSAHERGRPATLLSHLLYSLFRLEHGIRCSDSISSFQSDLESPASVPHGHAIDVYAAPPKLLLHVVQEVLKGREIHSGSDVVALGDWLQNLVSVITAGSVEGELRLEGSFEEVAEFLQAVELLASHVSGTGLLVTSISIRFQPETLAENFTNSEPRSGICANTWTQFLYCYASVLRDFYPWFSGLLSPLSGMRPGHNSHQQHPIHGIYIWRHLKKDIVRLAAICTTG